VRTVSTNFLPKEPVPPVTRIDFPDNISTPLNRHTDNSLETIFHKKSNEGSAVDSETTGGVVLISYFVRRYGSAPSSMKSIRRIKDNAINRPDVLVGMDHTGRNYDHHIKLLADPQLTHFVIGGGVWPVVPKTQKKSGRADKAKTVGLFPMFVGSSHHTRFCQ
jgi:hypothetical protein